MARSYGQSTARLLAFPLLIFLLLMTTFWIYSPGQFGPHVLDDRGSLLSLENLKDNRSYAKDYIFGDKSGDLGRPVSMASFVFEKLYFDRGVVGQKRTNILIHLLNGVLVVWVMWLLFREKDYPYPEFIALLMGACWLLAPLNVSTVLYVVQRMAMLAATFMLAASVSFIYWRGSISKRKHVVTGALLTCCFCLMALFSKENGILIIVLLPLMEILYFRNDASLSGSASFYKSNFFFLGAITLCAIFLFGYMWADIEAGYEIAGRSFNLTERVLTQSRIVWDYVGQTFFPEVNRMGVFHDDYVVSTSLFKPIETGFSVLAWIFVATILAVLCKWRWGACLAFAGLWFLVSHSLESTILALELYFEHRNYFPGIGLFLLLGSMTGMLLKRWKTLSSAILVWLVLYLLYLALQTSSQVQVWSNAALLRLNNVAFHPESARANEEISIHLAGVGAIEGALRYHGRAVSHNSRESEDDARIRELGLYCLTDQPFPIELLELLGSSNPARPLSTVSVVNGLVGMLNRNECPSFDELAFSRRLAEIYLSDPEPNRASPNLYIVLAALENAKMRFESAHQYSGLALESNPEDIKGLLMHLHFSVALGKADEARKIYSKLNGLVREGRLSDREVDTLSLYREFDETRKRY